MTVLISTEPQLLLLPFNSTDKFKGVAQLRTTHSLEIFTRDASHMTCPNCGRQHVLPILGARVQPGLHNHKINRFCD
jgi:hypothetical protein